jgi:hypothetical protein
VAGGAVPPADRERYLIVAEGEFGELLSAAFRDASIKVGPKTTELAVQVADDQELYGILDRLRDHAVRVISFHREE